MRTIRLWIARTRTRQAIKTPTDPSAVSILFASHFTYSEVRPRLLKQAQVNVTWIASEGWPSTASHPNTTFGSLLHHVRIDVDYHYGYLMTPQLIEKTLKELPYLDTLLLNCVDWPVEVPLMPDEEIVYDRDGRMLSNLCEKIARHVKWPLCPPSEQPLLCTATKR